MTTRKQRNVITMKCRRRRQLAGYQVGALGAVQRAAVERHLHDCRACQAELTALNRTVALLRPAAQMDAPPQVWTHISRQLTPRRRASRVARWAPAMAAAMLVLIIAVVFVVPLVDGHFAGLQTQDTYADMQVAAAWDNPLADKAALGLAVLATTDTQSDFIQETVD